MSDLNAAAHDDLARVLKRLVDEPDGMKIDAVPMRRATIFEVDPAPDDVGKVIGRRGRVARALRVLLDCRGDVEGSQYGLEIVSD